MRHPSFLTALFALIGALALPMAGVVAQDAADPFADLGLPEIAVTITADEITVDQPEIAAGRYVLRMTNGSEEDDLGIGFIQPPDGQSATDFIDLLASLAPATPEPGASEVEASPVGEGAPEGPPPFYYEVPLAGGIYADAGETASQVLDLSAGEWVVWAEDPAAAQTPAPLVVTGELPADLPEPEADVTITGVEMAFEIEGTLAARPQVIEFANGGEQPHFLLMIRVPAGTTIEEFFEVAESFGNPMASPTASGLTFADLDITVNTGDQSSGVTTWIEADLSAGDYVVVCFVTDPETGVPHAFEGMVGLVTVA